MPFWRDLHYRLSPDNPFIGPKWSGKIFDSQKAIHGQKLLILVSAEKGQEAVLPLSVTRTFQFGLPTYRVESIGLGNSPTKRHYVFAQEPLAMPDSWNLLIEEIKGLSKWNLLRFAPIPENHPMIHALDQVSSYQNLTYVRRPYSKGFKIVFKGRSWKDYELSRSKKFLKRMRSAIRKSVKNFNYNIVAYRDQDDEDRMTEAIFTISKNSWKADIGSDLFNEIHYGFYHKVLSDYLKAGKSIVWVLYDHDRPIAFEWHLRHNCRSIALKGDYDQAYARFSPGNVVAWHACKSCFDDRIDEVDYLFGGSTYKKKWATDEYLLEEVILFKKDLYSKFVLEAFKHQKLYEKLWRLNPKWRLQAKKK